MFDHIRKAGATSQVIEVMLRSSTTGGGATGIAYTAVTASYCRAGGTRQAITLASGTAGDAYSSGKWAEVDSTNQKGLYQLHVPDAAIAAGVPHVTISLQATGVLDKAISVELIAPDLQDTVRLGLTALPNAAAEAAGGLYTRGSGAGQINQAANGQVDTNSVAISGDSTAADNLEAQFDGTGVTGGTYPATQAQVSAIGSGTGAALNFSADSDNASSPIKSITKVGTETNTFANTANDNGVYHIITNATNNIDWVYGFSIGSGRAASKAVFVGYLAATAPATGKTITVQAYNFSTPGWDTVKTITGQAGTTDITVDIALLSSHTGTGAEAGKVYIRFAATSQAGAVLNTDQLYVQAQNLGMTVGYANGSIWVKATGTAGTTPYVHGTADNPCPWASAKTLNTTLGLNRYVITPGTSVTLDAALALSVVTGRSYSLALGGQNISGSYFEGVEGLSGTGTCATAEAIIVDSHLNAITIGEADFIRSHLMDVITLSQASVPYRFHDCTGIAAASKIVFSAASQSAVVSKMSGVLTIAGMVSTNTLYIDGEGDVTLDATNTGGSVYISGGIRLTNLGSGQTIVDTSRWGEEQSVGSVTLKTGYSLAASQAFDLTGNITGNLSGTVGSVTGAVASVTNPVTVSDKTGYSLSAAGNEAAADALLNRNVSGGSNVGRLVKQALHFLRNKWVVATGTLTVYDTDDNTPSWTATVSSNASADPITGNDPE